MTPAVHAWKGPSAPNRYIGELRNLAVYNFGIYHWRQRVRRLVLGVFALVVGTIEARRGGLVRRVTSVGLVVVGLRTAGRPVRKLAASPPWSLDPEKYDALAGVLPLGTANHVLDIGCGTGRSLVGLAPAIRPTATVIGLDVFDDRVILGNGPTLARRNATRAGLAMTPIRGDAADLPISDDTVDVVTVCRVLHDLPEQDARRALAEARRVLSPDGTLGVLELPIPHDEGADPERYWSDLLNDAGFTVTECRVLDGEYFILVATP